MGKITKRSVELLRPEPNKDVFAWDSEMRGFGVRVKPSGAKTFLIQYRNIEGRTRRLVLGQFGAVTPEMARTAARKKLPPRSPEEQTLPRNGTPFGRALLVAEVCDSYLKEAGSGRLPAAIAAPSRRRVSPWIGAGSRVHIKPLLGTRLVSRLTLRTSRQCKLTSPLASGRGGKRRRSGRPLHRWIWRSGPESARFERCSDTRPASASSRKTRH